MQNPNQNLADRLFNDDNSNEVVIEIGLLSDRNLDISDFEEVDNNIVTEKEMLIKKGSNDNTQAYEAALNCEDYQALMGEYLDNDLSEGLKNFFDTHTKNCKKCNEVFLGYKKVIELAGDLNTEGVELDIKVPEGFMDEESDKDHDLDLISKRLKENLAKNLGISFKK